MIMIHPPSLQIQNFLMKNRKSLNSGLIYSNKTELLLKNFTMEMIIYKKW